MNTPLRPRATPARRQAELDSRTTEIENLKLLILKLKRMLQADGYAGFNKLYETGRIVEAACWAHVRRKFHDLYEAHRSPIANEALERIGQLYGIEQEIRGRSPAERKEVRQARSRPLQEAMQAWLKATLGKLSQKSDVAVAIRYALERWSALLRYCEDGRVEMDNNAAIAASGSDDVMPPPGLCRVLCSFCWFPLGDLSFWAARLSA